MVGGHPERVEHLCDLLVDASNFDVIVMESIAGAYSRIKQVTPDFVVVLMTIDDVAGCQLLSMLKIDRDLSGIPLVICATQGGESELEDDNASQSYGERPERRSPW